mgnify:CR=1 FL=1
MSFGNEQHIGHQLQRDHLFQEELLPHAAAIYNFALRLSLDEDEAKDLVQETYFKAYKFIDSFHKGTNAKAWLYRILKNNFINEYRKKIKEPTKIDYQDVESVYNSDEPQETFTGSIAVYPFKEAIGDEVSKALNSLPIDFKIVIILCDLEEFTYEEMSKILDIPIGTVRSRLHRARNILRNKLLQYAKSKGFKRELK